MLGGLFKKMFGGGAEEKGGGSQDRSSAIEYKGFTIIPAPMKHGGQFLTRAIIEREFPDGLKTHELIRADTHGSADDAGSFAVTKAKQVIDEQGERIFR